LQQADYEVTPLQAWRDRGEDAPRRLVAVPDKSLHRGEECLAGGQVIIDSGDVFGDVLGIRVAQHLVDVSQAVGLAILAQALQAQGEQHAHERGRRRGRQGIAGGDVDLAHGVGQAMHHVLQKPLIAQHDSHRPRVGPHHVAQAAKPRGDVAGLDVLGGG